MHNGGWTAEHQRQILHTSTSKSHCFHFDVQQRHSISRLLTADRAHIHGPLSALRQRWKKKKLGKKDRTDGQDARKNSKKPMDARRQWLEMDGHSPNSRSTCAVSGWATASPGCCKPSHVTLFMNGAVWRRDDAAQRAEEGRGGCRRGWNFQHRLREEEQREMKRRGEEDEAVGVVFQSSTSWEQQVRLRWCLCK